MDTADHGSGKYLVFTPEPVYRVRLDRFEGSASTDGGGQFRMGPGCHSILHRCSARRVSHRVRASRHRGVQASRNRGNAGYLRKYLEIAVVQGEKAIAGAAKAT